MQKLLKLNRLTMIALLSCFIDLSTSRATNTFPTGENYKDSVLVAIDDLRNANAKLIELKYEKEINAKLRDIVNKDSVVIESYSKYATSLNNKVRKYKRQRNVAASGGGIAILLLILSLFK